MGSSYHVVAFSLVSLNGVHHIQVEGKKGKSHLHNGKGWHVLNGAIYKTVIRDAELYIKNGSGIVFLIAFGAGAIDTQACLSVELLCTLWDVRQWREQPSAWLPLQPEVSFLYTTFLLTAIDPAFSSTDSTWMIPLNSPRSCCHSDSQNSHQAGSDLSVIWENGHFANNSKECPYEMNFNLGEIGQINISSLYLTG